METERSIHDYGSRTSAVLNVLIGLWLFVSPWVYAAAGSGNAWNSWIVGGLIALFAIIRYSNLRAQALAWLNMALGAWVFISP
jgi:hypothetical protein